MLWILTPPYFCRVKVAPSDTARQQSAAKPFAPSGRRGTASATHASFDIWISRYEKEYIFDASEIMVQIVVLCVSYLSTLLCVYGCLKKISDGPLNVFAHVPITNISCISFPFREQTLSIYLNMPELVH